MYRAGRNGILVLLCAWGLNQTRGVLFGFADLGALIVRSFGLSQRAAASYAVRQRSQARK